MHAKCTIPRQKKSKNVLGRGTAPPQIPSSLGGVTPFPNPTPVGACSASILAPSTLDLAPENENPGSANAITLTNLQLTSVLPLGLQLSRVLASEPIARCRSNEGENLRMRRCQLRKANDACVGATAAKSRWTLLNEQVNEHYYDWHSSAAEVGRVAGHATYTSLSICRFVSVGLCRAASSDDIITLDKDWFPISVGELANFARFNSAYVIHSKVYSSIIRNRLSNIIYYGIGVGLSHLASGMSLEAKLLMKNNFSHEQYSSSKQFYYANFPRVSQI